MGFPLPLLPFCDDTATVEEGVVVVVEVETLLVSFSDLLGKIIYSDDRNSDGNCNRQFCPTVMICSSDGFTNLIFTNLDFFYLVLISYKQIVVGESKYTKKCST